MDKHSNHQYRVPSTAVGKSVEAIAGDLREALAGHAEIEFAYLHGSVLDVMTPNDVDVGVYLTAAAAARTDAFQYENDLSRSLSRLLHLPIDVHVLNGAPLANALPCADVSSQKPM